MALRANRDGLLIWQRDSTQDRTGLWIARAQGDSGSTTVITYTLKELDLPADPVNVGQSEFLVYRTPEAFFHFDRSVHTGTVAWAAGVYREALATVPASMGTDFAERVDFFLFSDRDALKRAVRATGTNPGEGPLAGISLHGFDHPRIYLDVASPYAGAAHILGHEFLHQVSAHIAGPRPMPAWLDEGLAEYFGVVVASKTAMRQELQWRRSFRGAVREAITSGGWIDLASLASRDVWTRETDLHRVDLMYGEGYATADFVAHTYGERALRSFLEAMADHPDDPEAAVRILFNISFSEFQRRVREDVLQPDDYERQTDALVTYARRLFAIMDQEAVLKRRWSEYPRLRGALTRPQRQAQLLDLSNGYAGLLARAQDAGVFGAPADTHELFLQALAAFIKAMDGFARFEDTGESAAVTLGNASLDRGNFLLGAAQDWLVMTLQSSGISAGEVRA